MKSENYFNTMDKTSWPDGPWKFEEPDKCQWEDKETGLPCLIVRSHMGNLCGYTGVFEEHPFYGVEYGDCSLPEAKERGPRDGDEEGIGGMKTPEFMLKAMRKKKVCAEEWCDHRPESQLDVHGGITYSGFCQEGLEESVGICHKPEPGEPEKVFWFGYDCAHSGDLVPGMILHDLSFRAKHPEFSLVPRTDVYRDIEYVRNECKSLAKQLVELAK